TLTKSGAIFGTLPYMSPEQLRGQPADTRSDVWSLGIVLYEMAAGKKPFDGETGFELSSAIFNEAPRPLRSSVPLKLKDVITHCLEKQPSGRYQDGREVRAALDINPVPSQTLPRWAPRIVVGTLALAIALFAFNVGSLRTRLTGTSPSPTPTRLAVL